MRPHIAITGKRNSGKSSLINALTDQNVAIVSPVAGTTTDPVYKTMELLPLGPVVLIDTPGLDDIGDLGALRIQKTNKVLTKADIVVLVIDVCDPDYPKLSLAKDIPLITVINKIDLIDDIPDTTSLKISCKTGEGIPQLIERLIELAPTSKKRLLGDLITPGDLFILVVPIDLAAPKDRLILPQVQTIRDILDHNGIAVVLRETELASTLPTLSKRPKMVITDSQVFPQVDRETPNDILLTSFSILMARYKGDLQQLINGINAIENLKANDRVLIAEACSHHRKEEDIGTVKIPVWLENKVGSLQFTWVRGGDFPEDLKPFKLIIHCGGCMLNEKEMQSRLNQANIQNIPIVNYGSIIAYMHGILKRALEPFQ